MAVAGLVLIGASILKSHQLLTEPILKTEVDRSINDIMDRFGISKLSTQRPGSLSGGQAQLVTIARALVHPQMRVLLMDEPFSALDAYTREELQDELLRIWQETGKTILFVTHDMREARYLSDRIIMLGGEPVKIIKDEVIEEKRPRKR